MFRVLIVSVINTQNMIFRLFVTSAIVSWSTSKLESNDNGKSNNNDNKTEKTTCYDYIMLFSPSKLF